MSVFCKLLYMCNFFLQETMNVDGAINNDFSAMPLAYTGVKIFIMMNLVCTISMFNLEHILLLEHIYAQY